MNSFCLVDDDGSNQFNTAVAAANTPRSILDLLLLLFSTLSFQLNYTQLSVVVFLSLSLSFAIIRRAKGKRKAGRFPSPERVDSANVGPHFAQRERERVSGEFLNGSSSSGALIGRNSGT